MPAPKPSIIDTRRHQMFPTLVLAEIERLRRFGVLRSYGPGEALVKVGEVGAGLTIILAGEVQVTQHDQSGRRELIVTHGAGAFMGELAQLSGRPALVDAYAQGPVDALIIAPERLCWIAFGHYEADECGAMNDWLAIAPQATVAHGRTGCYVSLNDMADRSPRILADGETIDLGKGRRVRYLDTPHIPHGWDAGVLYEEASGTLLCGDLFTQTGDRASLTESDIVGPAIAAEDMFRFSSLNPGMGKTIRQLAKLEPRTLALMHGPSFTGDGSGALNALADDYDRRVREAMTQ